MLGYLTVGQAVEEVNWIHALSVSTVAALICFIKQLVKLLRGLTVEDQAGAQLAQQMKELHNLATETVDEPEDSEVIEYDE